MHGWGDRFEAGKGENAETAYFDQQMWCSAPVGWSTYTTMEDVILVYGLLASIKN